MEKVKKLKRGLDIGIHGKAEKKLDTTFQASTYAIKPTDFFGIAPIPKLLVKEGDEVKAGDQLFYDKSMPDVFYTAPVSGEVVEIRRGAKRSIAEVVILGDKTIKYKSFSIGKVATLSKDKVVKLLKESGLWLTLKQRPFNLVADSNVIPKSIHISGFDSNPLAADYRFTLNGKKKEFQAGLDVLHQLTTGGVDVGLNADARTNEVIENARGINKHYFAGPHPAGNVGVQIHHINPINKGEVVWTINPNDVAIIGEFFLTGKVNMERIIAITGPEILHPRYIKTYAGASIENMIKDNLSNDHVRYISGSVLTGKKIEANGHLGFYDHSLTVIEEGDKYEFMGWLIPSYPRPSLSRTFWTGLLNAMNIENTYSVNTNSHGEPRAFVVSGQYEQVLPMDIYPVQLLKSIMYNDLDKMEGLGIYELVEEDLALCEFVCTSKTEVQKVLREGLDYVKSQT